MSKLEKIFLYIVTFWLVTIFTYVIVGMGYATGERTSLWYEIPMGILFSLLIFGWLALFPNLTNKSRRFRNYLFVLAMPGALISVVTTYEQGMRLLSGRHFSVVVLIIAGLTFVAYLIGYTRMLKSYPGKEPSNKALQYLE